MIPFVHLNLALAADGRFREEGGAPRSISCPRDWRRVHRLRESYDAIAVGAVTWRSDRPRLTARSECLGREPRSQPDRVIFSGAHSCPIEPDGRRTFAVSALPSATAGVVFIECPDRRLADPLRDLRHHGVRSLLVEGGPCLLRSFLSQGCFDVLTIYVAASSALTACAAVRRLFPEAPELATARLGEGVLLTGQARGKETADGSAPWSHGNPARGVIAPQPGAARARG